jgi:hypothetical protein
MEYQEYFITTLLTNTSVNILETVTRIPKIVIIEISINDYSATVYNPFYALLKYFSLKMTPVVDT